MRYLVAALCLLYLVFPTGGVLEVAPDVLPIVGHLDEIAVTYIMTTMLGWQPGRERSFKGWEIAGITFLGLASILYMMFPTIGTFEIIPDFVPIAGNVDEIIASVITFTMANSYRSPDKKKKRGEELVDEATLRESHSGEYIEADVLQRREEKLQ